jgi:hypothetical protein
LFKHELQVGFSQTFQTQQLGRFQAGSLPKDDSKNRLRFGFILYPCSSPGGVLAAGQFVFDVTVGDENSQVGVF